MRVELSWLSAEASVFLQPPYPNQAKGTGAIMTKLKSRYDHLEFETLTACIKPVERWTAEEHRGWAQTGSGFRHFLAANVIPIEHFRPKPRPVYSPIQGQKLARARP